MAAEGFEVVRRHLENPLIRGMRRVALLRRELHERGQLEDAHRARIRLLQRRQLGLGSRQISAGDGRADQQVLSLGVGRLNRQRLLRVGGRLVGVALTEVEARQREVRRPRPRLQLQHVLVGRDRFGDAVTQRFDLSGKQIGLGRAWRVRLVGDHGGHRSTRLVALAVGQRYPRAQEQRPWILRVLLEHFVQPILCLRPVPFGRIERGQPHAGGGKPLIVSGDVTKHLSRVLGALGDGVVVGQRERCGLGGRELRDRLEIGLGLRHPPAGHVEQTQRAVGGGVLHVDLQGGLQLGLGALLIARRPEEIGEREVRRDRFRRRGHRLLECLFSLDPFALHQLDGRQIAVGRRLRRVERDRVLILRDGGVEVLQAGQGVPAQHLGVDALGIQRESPCPRAPARPRTLAPPAASGRP